jgi:hypothetical protein
MDAATCVVGPYLHETLRQRLDECSRKLALSTAPPVEAWLRARFDASPQCPLQRMCILRGFTFRPLHAFLSGAFTWDGHPHLSHDRNTGWWAPCLRDVLRSPLLADADDDDSRWVLLTKKCHWLSDVVARPHATGPLVVEGVPELCIPSLPVFTTAQLPSAVRDDGTLASGMPVLLAQLALAGDGGEGGGSPRWRERSRGWVMHAGWDPSPLFAAPPQQPVAPQETARWSMMDVEGAAAAAAATTLHHRLGRNGMGRWAAAVATHERRGEAARAVAQALVAAVTAADASLKVQQRCNKCEGLG